jgi:hypothetical protein
MEAKGKKLVVVGDRVLVTPQEGEDRTRVGLLLPQSAVDKMEVQSGRIVEVGPGTPVQAPSEFGEEPWKLRLETWRFFYAMPPWRSSLNGLPTSLFHMPPFYSWCVATRKISTSNP